MCNKAFVLALCALALLRGGGTAQTITGQVVDSTRQVPVGAGFVVVLDAADREVARVLTTATGHFSIRIAAAGGPYRLRSERIGYRLEVSEPFDAAPGETVQRDLLVSALPVRLAAIEVREERRCRIRPGEGEDTALLWEEVRKALSAASWTASQALYRFQSSIYERHLDARRRRVREESVRSSGGVYKTPFASRDADRLAEEGYIVREGEDNWYYAPDANVMLSDAFLDTHCFRVVREDKDRPGEIGLAFEPVPGRVAPDIEGVIWLDETSSELRNVEYSYTNDPYGLDDRRIGGTVEFMPVPSGAWIVNRWQIRMPTQGARTVRDEMGTRREPRMTGFMDAGGEVVEITTLEGDTLYTAPLARLQGMVVDSARAVPAPLSEAVIRIVGTSYATTTDAGGRYQLAAPLEGEYAVTFSHPRLDSLGAHHESRLVALARNRPVELLLAVPPLERIVKSHCSGNPLGPEERILVGVVRDGASGRPYAGAEVTAAWQSLRFSGQRLDNVRVQVRTATAFTDSVGAYAICGLEAGRPAEVAAARANRISAPLKVLFEDQTVQIDTAPLGRYDEGFFLGSDLIWKQDLEVHPAAAITGQIRGLVTDAVTGTPLPDARILLLGADRLVETNEAGAFRFRELPPGAYVLFLQRPGYAPLRREIAVEPGETVAFQQPPLRLVPIGEEDESVVDSPSAQGEARLAGFNRRRERGIGSYITRDEFRRMGRPSRPTDVLRRMSGVSVTPNGNYLRGNPPDTRRWLIVTDRGAGSTGRPGIAGSRADCSPVFFLDGQFLGDGAGVDIDQAIPVEALAAVEAYGGSAGVPPRFNRLGSTCGVILFWTR